MKNISIIGSGSFGCALAYLFSKKNNVKIWSFKEEEANYINNEHKCIYLSDLKLDEKIKCYLKYEDALSDSDIIVLVTPSFAFRKTCEDIKKYVKNQDIILATKGMDNGELLSSIIEENFDKKPSIISGPSHAEQIIMDIKTYVNFYGNKELINILENDNFKLIYNEDSIGMQVGASLKNIISLGCGILEGLDYDTNTISYFITEGLNEIKKISNKLGGKEETIYGLSGLGDLLTTCLSLDSRNKRAGILLAKGKTIEEIKKQVGMTIEGLDALSNAYILINKYNLDCKIIKNIYDIIYNNKDIKSII